MSAFPEPAQRLAPQARWAWRLGWFTGCGAALIAIGTLREAVPSPWPGIAMGAALVALVAGTPLVPELRYRRWRWEVREEEIDLVRGILVVRRTLIPMARVQHVETEQGLIGQALGLSTVEIHTAAGSHAIPLLRDADAAAIRARIAELARTDAAPAAAGAAPEPEGLEAGGESDGPPAGAAPEGPQAGADAGAGPAPPDPVPEPPRRDPDG